MSTMATLPTEENAFSNGNPATPGSNDSTAKDPHPNGELSDPAIRRIKTAASFSNLPRALREDVPLAAKYRQG